MYEIRPSVVSGKPRWTIYYNNRKVIWFGREDMAINYIASVRFVDNFAATTAISQKSVLGVRHGS
jgi:hypothetical protein